MTQHHDKRQYLINIILYALCRGFVSVLRYERDFILSLKSDTQSDIIEASNKTSRYFEDIFNIDSLFLYIV